MPEQLLLDRKILDDGLDHKGGVADFLQRIDGLDARYQRRLLLGADTAAFDQAVEAACDALDGAFRGALGLIVELDRMAGVGRHLGHARAHGTGADHGDRLFGGESSHGVYFPVKRGSRFCRKAATPSR